MHRVVDWVKGLALTLGGQGLFIIAFLDSSVLSFPEVVDLLLMGLVIQHKERLVYYALVSTLGSIAGCRVVLCGSRVMASPALPLSTPRGTSGDTREHTRYTILVSIRPRPA